MTTLHSQNGKSGPADWNYRAKSLGPSDDEYLPVERDFRLKSLSVPRPQLDYVSGILLAEVAWMPGCIVGYHCLVPFSSSVYISELMQLYEAVGRFSDYFRVFCARVMGR